MSDFESAVAKLLVDGVAVRFSAKPTGVRATLTRWGRGPKICHNLTIGVGIGSTPSEALAAGIESVRTWLTRGNGRKRAVEFGSAAITAADHIRAEDAKGKR